MSEFRKKWLTKKPPVDERKRERMKELRILQTLLMQLLKTEFVVRRERGVFLLDEVDMLLHPLRSELNFPIGEKFPLTPNPSRWDLPIYLLDIILRASYVAMENDNISDDATIRELVDAFRNGLHEKTLQRTPHLVLLDHEFYASDVKDVISKRSLSWMKAHHVFDGLNEAPQHEDLLSYISNGNNSASQNSIKRLEAQGDIGKNALQCLNLAHDWSSSFVPHILSKVDRVSFGLLQPQDEAILTPNQPASRKLLGTFVGKGCLHQQLLLNLMFYRCYNSCISI